MEKNVYYFCREEWTVSGKFTCECMSDTYVFVIQQVNPGKKYHANFALPVNINMALHHSFGDLWISYWRSIFNRLLNMALHKEIDAVWIFCYFWFYLWWSQLGLWFIYKCTFFPLFLYMLTTGYTSEFTSSYFIVELSSVYEFNLDWQVHNRPISHYNHLKILFIRELFRSYIYTTNKRLLPLL